MMMMTMLMTITTIKFRKQRVSDVAV